MKFIECAQGTPEWLQARAGAITASCFADAIGVLTKNSVKRKAGDPTAAAEKYAGDLAIERISGKPYGEPPKAWVLERGHAMEILAREAYETRHGLLAMESGIVKTDDDWFGYSTDGLVGDDGLIEIKCPIASDKIVEMLTTGDVSEYVHQMQGGMWITGRKWCDFIMYVPDLESAGRDLFVKRIERDDDFINDMVDKLMSFRGTVTRLEAFFRGSSADAAVAPEPAAPTPVIPDQALLSMNRCCEKAVTEGVAVCSDCAENWTSQPRSDLTAPADTGERINLGVINEHLQKLSVNAAQLAALGFDPVATAKASKLYRACDLPRIREALMQHLAQLEELQTA